MKMLRKAMLVLGLISFLQLALPAAQISAEAFEPIDQACQGAAASSDVCSNQGQTENPVSGTNGIILKVVDIIALAVGVASVIMIIIGGIKMTMSGGDAGAVKSGRNTVIYALVGVVVILLARSLIVFVINRI